MITGDHKITGAIAEELVFLMRRKALTVQILKISDGLYRDVRNARCMRVA